MSKEKQDKKKKKKSLKGVAAVGLVAAAAWLFAHFPGLGLGLGTGPGADNAGATVPQTEENVSTEQTEATKVTKEIEVIDVVVAGDTITVNKTAASDEAAIRDRILEIYKDGISINLKDDKAVKASYDLAKKVLDDLGYSYTETK